MNSAIVNVDANNFNTEVIERSREVPVLVDFWAEWCAPCKMLLPVLTNLVEAYEGQFVLAKVNTDEQQELAMQHNIRSIPTLKLYRHGRMVEEIMGVQSEQALRALIDKYRERTVDKLRVQASQAYMQGDSERAIELLTQAQAQDPEYYPVQTDLAKVLMDNHQLEAAEKILKDLPANVQGEPEVVGLLTHLQLMQIVENAPAQSELEKTLANDADNHLARHQLAVSQALTGDYENALENFLELMKRDRQYEDDAGRRGMLSVFTLLENQGPLVTHYRSKMSSLLY